MLTIILSINHEDHEGSEVGLILRFLRDLRGKLSSGSDIENFFFFAFRDSLAYNHVTYEISTLSLHLPFSPRMRASFA